VTVAAGTIQVTMIGRREACRTVATASAYCSTRCYYFLSMFMAHAPLKPAPGFPASRDRHAGALVKVSKAL